MSRVLMVGIGLLVASLACAIDTGAAFDDPVLQQRYEQLIEEVRCLKCQNQNLRDSNAFLAADLRREIRRLLAEGNTDAQIYDFLVQRYGEFALYRPRMRGKTLVLWLAPLLLLLGGAVIVARIVKARMSLPLDDAEDTAEGPARE
ncbi:MAG: cytochrome c-type biogenesis protein CcmH [Woeseia sp.]|nr:cytochrome c-type biogenesis protein CcmH [Woeseia sp.]